MVIDLLGFGIVLPVLPPIGEMFLGPLIPGGKDAPMTGAILGLLMASFSAMQFIFAPVWGRVSDHIGRRPILLLGLGGSVVFYGLFGVATELGEDNAAIVVVLLFVSRLGAGIAGATIATAQAVIADSTTPEKRKHGMALIGAAFGIGFTIGPLVGFAALELFPKNLGGLGFVAAGLSLTALLLGIRLLPETRRPGETTSARQWFNWRGLQNALKTPTIGYLVMTFFLATYGFGQFEATLALLNQDILGLSKRQSFLVFAFVGFVLMLDQGLIYRRLARKVSEETFMGVGIVFMGAGLAGLGLATWLGGQDEPPGFGTLLSCTLLSLTAAVTGFAFLTPSAQALISRRSDPAKQGEVLGVNQSASALARILGPFTGITLYKLDKSHLWPYAFGAFLLVCMLPIIPRIRRGATLSP